MSLLPLLLCGISPLLIPTSTALASGTPVWLAGPAPGTAARVLPGPGGVLLASDSGLYRLEHGAWTPVLARRGVRDLARLGEGTLIATGAGLYEWPDTSPRPRLLPLGAGARASALAVDAEGRAWVATEVGLFSRGPTEPSFRREPSLPAGPVESVRAVGRQVWVASRGALWVRRGSGLFEPRLRRADPGWWELQAVIAVGDTVILSVPKGLWRLGPGGDHALELGLGEQRGLALVGDTAWVATDRGVFPLPIDRIETAPGAVALSAEVFDLARMGDRLVAATDRGVVTLSLDSPPQDGGPAVRRAPAPPSSVGVEVSRLHRVVLRYLGLTAAPMLRLERRARTTALLPEVRLDVGWERDHDHDHDFDQTFSSGEVRDLHDAWRRAQRAIGVSLQLVWNLQELGEPDHAIAIARERRERIELRDQVLERVNRLYFERLRVLARLAALQGSTAPEEVPAEMTELELRARELAANLDAWTGGGFSRLESNSPRKLETSP